MLAKDAPCKCGAAKKSFKFIPYSQIAGKWECPLCKDAEKKEEPKKEEVKAADINKDGKVDEKDLSIVHKEYSKEKQTKKKATKKKATKKKVVKKKSEEKSE